MNHNSGVRRGQATIDEVFVLYHDGRLILHETRRIRPDVDPDILASMLTAVQGFVADSFQSGAAMNEIGFGEKRLLLSSGRWLALAMVVEGAADTAAIHAAASDALLRMEEDHSQGLELWNGVASPLAAMLQPYVRDLVMSAPEPEPAVEPPRRRTSSTKLVAGVLAVSVLILSLAVLNLTGKLGTPVITIPGGEPPVVEEPGRSGALTVSATCGDWVEPCAGVQIKVEALGVVQNWSGTIASNATQSEPFVIKWKGGPKCVVANVSLVAAFGSNQSASVCDGDDKKVPIAVSPPGRMFKVRVVVSCDSGGSSTGCKVRGYLAGPLGNVTLISWWEDVNFGNPKTYRASFSTVATNECFEMTAAIEAFGKGVKTSSDPACDGVEVRLTVAF